MRRLVDVYAGALTYRKITRKNNNTFFILLTDDDEELNYYALKHIDRCAKIKGFENAAVVCGEEIYKQIFSAVRDHVQTVKLSDKQIGALTSYVLLKYTSGNYRSVLKNIRLVSFSNATTGLDWLYDIGIFDKEYIMWHKMLFCRDEYGDLIRAEPFKKIECQEQ